MSTPTTRPFLTVRETADFLGLGYRRTCALIERNHLSARRIDGRICVAVDDLADYVIASKHWRRTIGALAAGR